MSQQINLLLPELRRRRDWLAFPTVAVAALLVLLGVAGLALWGRQQVEALLAEQRRGEAELGALRQRVQALGVALAARRPNPALKEEVDRLAEGLRQRNEALEAVESGRSGSREGQSGAMRAFARQTVDGVWLTGFSLASSDVEIRGRLSDAALLPHYIRRLNGEPAFQGRRFAALAMQEGGAPAVAPGATPAAAAVTAPTAPKVAATLPPPTAAAHRYTEFVLHGTQPAAGEAR